MRVLVLGATGLIGSHVLKALQQTGCDAIGASRKKPASAGNIEWKELEFSSLVHPQEWHPHLQGIDAVINCVGIIREVHPGDFIRLHQQMPIALFAACEQTGISRVVQISALGSEPQAQTTYWRTKSAADADLLLRRLTATIVRPSLVYGDDGASSRVFMMLASLPFAAMPMAHSALVQPIHVDDLTAVLVKLLTGNKEMPTELAAVGPRALSIADYVGALRQGMSAAPGIVVTIPPPLARVIAACAGLIPSSALTRDSLKMLEQSADGSNTADPAPITTLLGAPPRDPRHFTRTQQKGQAVLAWAAPMFRFFIAMLWLLTAYASWFGWSHEESRQWLMQCGLPQAWTEPTLLAACLLDTGIGMVLLLYYRRWIWPVQIVLVLGYTIVMSCFLPQFWMHPFGPLSKNLPILAIMFTMWRLAENNTKKKGSW